MNDEVRGASTTVVDGDYIAIRATSSASWATTADFTVPMLGIDRSWTLGTREQAVPLSSFAFNDVIDAFPGEYMSIPPGSASTASARRSRCRSVAARSRSTAATGSPAAP